MGMLLQQEELLASAMSDGGLLTHGLEERCPSDVEQMWHAYLARQKPRKGAVIRAPSKQCLPQGL